ncbi:hypothetical protein ACFWF7_01360 [Nocardia sp. NPDC060256]|uniref:hypothetical protein n=1 Tax=unclassified Nocardia TaxID=2637762 RepID=UPI0036595291
MSDEQATPEVAEPAASDKMARIEPGTVGALSLRYVDGVPELVVTGGIAVQREIMLKDSTGRSIAPFSLDTPHTGGQSYAAGVPRVPAACITIEDAELMWRSGGEGEAP